jgi:hypothetical protein
MYATSSVPEGEALLVPASVFKSLLLRGIEAPLPVEEFFDEGGTMKKSESDAPPMEKAPEDPFEHLVPGRVVHYWPRDYEARDAGAGPWAAIVTKVEDHLPGHVTLNVQMPAPPPVGTDPVYRMSDVPYSAEKAGGCWSWIFPGQASRYKPDRTA